MSMGLTKERPEPPKPAYISLPAACEAAIRHGNSLADIRIAKWSETFGNCGSEQVKTAWEAALTRVSLQPRNYEEMDK